MDKRRAIQIMTKAAQLYKEQLEDQKVLFLCGLPKEVNKQLQEKANRKKNMKKQRIMNIVRKCVLSLTALALVGWLGYSAYVSHESKQEREVAEVNYDAVNNYLSGLGE